MRSLSLLLLLAAPLKRRQHTQTGQQWPTATEMDASLAVHSYTSAHTNSVVVRIETVRGEGVGMRMERYDESRDANARGAGGESAQLARCGYGE